MTRFTVAVTGPIAGATLLHLLARITGGDWLALASAGLAALPAAAVVLRPRLDGIEVVRHAPRRVRLGDEVDVRLTVRNTTRRPSPPLLLTDDLPGLEPCTVAVASLPPGASVIARTTRRAVRRGAADGGPATLVSTAPFGLVRCTRTASVAGRLVVHPAVATPRGPGSGRPGQVGLASRAVPGLGTDVLGLRDWRSGDTARALHARASARHGRPLVLEREHDTGPALVVLVAGVGHGAGWERAVARAAATAVDAVRRGCPPVLIAAGLPAPQRVDEVAVLDWFATVDAARPADDASRRSARQAAGPGGSLLVLGGSHA